MNDRRALFVDRDGIFHALVPWGPAGELCAPRNWNELTRYPEIDGIEGVKELGFLLVLVTNQPDVERGIIERRFVDEVNEVYRAEHLLDAVYVCWNSSDSHPMKKPNPGMFLEASKDLSIALERSFHLGDTARDVEGARRAGCQSILWDRPYNRHAASNFRISELSQLREILSGKDNRV